MWTRRTGLTFAFGLVVVRDLDLKGGHAAIVRPQRSKQRLALRVRDPGHGGAVTAIVPFTQRLNPCLLADVWRRFRQIARRPKRSGRGDLAMTALFRSDDRPTPRPTWPRRVLWTVVVALVAGLGVRIIAVNARSWVSAVEVQLDPERRALRSALDAPQMADLREAYTARQFRPIWFSSGRLNPEARTFAVRLAHSREDGLQPDHYGGDQLSTLVTPEGRGQNSDRAQLELRLSHAYADYISDLHTPLPAAKLVFTDVTLRPPDRPDHAAVIGQLANAKSLSSTIDQATRMNPLYEKYRNALSAFKRPDPQNRRLLLVNLERARALPVDLGQRFVLVDAASANLWLFENGRVVDTMKVIVGKPTEATPMMAGVIRYAIFNPYWNVPPDLIRETYAPQVRARASALEALRMDPWSDYTDEARKLDPASIDWAAVARGDVTVGLRQRPGDTNSMGAVKFMLPNELGIYLHDTPKKALFAKAQRNFSAGCVRVEDYRRLERWLYGRSDIGPRGSAPEQRVNLLNPAPVYITYLTAIPGADRIILNPDIYSRDAALAAQLQVQELRPHRSNAIALTPPSPSDHLPQ
jgi:murein L,D-transpeptidase YcbB/YkuD